MSMKRIWSYTCITFGLITVFAIGNYICYQSAMDHFQQMQEDYESRVGEQIAVDVNKEMEERLSEIQEEEEEKEAVEADADQNTLQEDCIYQIQSFDSVTQTTTTEYENLPEEMIGCTREEAEAFCKDYMQNLAVEEFLEGLQSMNVISFSGDRLVIRKIYDASKVAYRYYLIADHGQVIAYYGDKKTVFEETGIQTASLPREDRKALKNGIEVKDEQELFAILENYSS